MLTYWQVRGVDKGGRTCQGDGVNEPTECEATDRCEAEAVAEVTDGGMYLLAVCEHHRSVALDRLGWAEA